MSPRPLGSLLRRVTGSQRLEFIADGLAQLPLATVTDHVLVERRHRDRDVLLELLGELFTREPSLGSAVDSVLLGATKIHQLEDNLGAVDVVLTAEDLARLDEATKIQPIYPSSNWVEIDTVARYLQRLESLRA